MITAEKSKRLLSRRGLLDELLLRRLEGGLEKPTRRIQDDAITNPSKFSGRRAQRRLGHSGVGWDDYTYNPNPNSYKGCMRDWNPAWERLKSTEKFIVKKQNHSCY